MDSGAWKEAATGPRMVESLYLVNLTVMCFARATRWCEVKVFHIVWNGEGIHDTGSVRGHEASPAFRDEYPQIRGNPEDPRYGRLRERIGLDG
jgi:hypothetical protein